MRRVAMLVLVGVFATACGVLDGDEEDVMAVWDLRETRSVEAVGWPEDAGETFEATTGQGLERILLPGGLTIDGTFRVNLLRAGGLAGEPHELVLQDLSVTFERESVEAVRARADAYADRLDLGPLGIPGWATANRASQDPGNATSLSASTTLGDTPIVVQMETRAFLEGEAVLRVHVSWRDVAS